MRKKATPKEIHKLIGCIVADPDFRASIEDDSEKAIKDDGYKLTEEQMAALEQTDMKALDKDLEDRLSKVGWNIFF